MDKFSGQSGTFRVNGGGEREPVKDSHTVPHKDGDAPRDADGKRLDRGKDHEEQAKPQPSLPEPAKAAPWATPAPAAETITTTSRKRASE